MNQAMYPAAGDDRKLPVYLIGIGLTDYENHIIRPEGHWVSQVLCSIRGKGRLILDGKEYTITGGQAIFLPAKHPHEYYPIDDIWETHWVSFDGAYCRQLLNSLNLTKAMICDLDDMTLLESLFKKMFVALKSDRIYGAYTCSALLYSYLIEFNRVFNNKSVGLTYNTDRSRILMPILNYIDEYFQTDISLTKLAEISGVSKQHLCHIFKEVLKLRPTEYIAKRRIEEAKGLLGSTQMPILEIATAVGFSDPSYFSAVFKRFENISPGDYRKISYQIFN